MLSGCLQPLARILLIHYHNLTDHAVGILVVAPGKTEDGFQIMGFYYLKKIFGNGNGSGNDQLLPAEQFRTLILHECARCDRNAHAFSLIHIDLRPDGRNNGLDRDRTVRQLSKFLEQRMRSTDVFGWLDENSVGVFLPETGKEGARSLARDACKGYSYQIYSYPSTTDINNDLNMGGPRYKRRGKGDRDRGASRGTGMEKQVALNLEKVKGTFERTGGVQEDSAASHSSGVANSIFELIMPPGAPTWKRAYDIFGSTVLLIAFSPVFTAVAVYIKIVSPGPVFFRQKRVGYLGRPFEIWKFRTMKHNADCGVHKSHLKDLINGDKVLTKLDQESDGRWIPLAGLLRKTCLDELPQLFNVLKGEMSLVGPRPVPDYEAEEYTLWQHQRFHSVPGMTGLWQVSGKNRLTFSQMMRLDARYSRKFNIIMDLLIFVKTVPAILGQVSDSVRGKYSSYPFKKNVSVWKRSLNEFVRHTFL